MPYSPPPLGRRALLAKIFTLALIHYNIFLSAFEKKTMINEDFLKIALILKK